MNDHDPTVSEEEKALRVQLGLLRQEHADMDAAIDALALVPIPDQLLIMRMKRKKLALRDEIVKIEDSILPDIIA